MTNLDARLKWFTIGALAATIGAGALAGGLRVSLVEALGLITLSTPLAAMAVFCWRRGWHAASACSIAILQFVLFTCLYTAVACLVAAAQVPLVDRQLAQIDQWLHIDVAAAVQWAAEQPYVDKLLSLSYHTVVPQTLLTVFILGYLETAAVVDRFMLRLMVAALLTLALFVAFPAVGPFEAGGYAPDGGQRQFASFIGDLRAGSETTMRLFYTKGLITFPSFHTAWAMIITIAYLRYGALLLLFGLLNLAVVASTLTTGWHYGSDVVGGFIVGGMAIMLAQLVPPSRSGSAHNLSR